MVTVASSAIKAVSGPIRGTDLIKDLKNQTNDTSKTTDNSTEVGKDKDGKETKTEAQKTEAEKKAEEAAAIKRGFKVPGFEEAKKLLDTSNGKNAFGLKGPDGSSAGASQPPEAAQAAPAAVAGGGATTGGSGGGSGSGGAWSGAGAQHSGGTGNNPGTGGIGAGGHNPPEVHGGFHNLSEISQHAGGQLQNNGHSIQFNDPNRHQLADIREYAKEHGSTISETYANNGKPIVTLSDPSTTNSNPVNQGASSIEQQTTPLPATVAQQETTPPPPPEPPPPPPTVPDQGTQQA